MVTVETRSTDDMVVETLRKSNEVIDDEERLEDDSTLIASLHSYIMAAFHENREARENSGMNEQMLGCLRAYNGEYSSSELARIEAEGGSKIYMNLTSTKVRAAISWIKDILLASKEDAWSIRPTAVPNSLRK